MGDGTPSEVEQDAELSPLARGPFGRWEPPDTDVILGSHAQGAVPDFPLWPEPGGDIDAYGDEGDNTAEEPSETVIVQDQGSNRIEGDPIFHPTIEFLGPGLVRYGDGPVDEVIIQRPPDDDGDAGTERTGLQCNVKKDIPWGPCGDPSGPCRYLVPPDPQESDVGCYEYYKHSTGEPCDPHWGCETNPGSVRRPLELSPGLRDVLDPCWDVPPCDGRGRSFTVVDRELRASGGGKPDSAPSTKPPSECPRGIHYDYYDLSGRIIGTVLCCECCTIDRKIVEAMDNCRITYQ